jgi:putative spermidine/putrescine transport system permease protein
LENGPVARIVAIGRSLLRLMIASTKSSTRLIALACALPLLAAVLLFEIAPLVLVAINSLSKDGALSFAYYGELIGSGFQRNAFLNSFLLSLGTSLIAVVFGLPLANALRKVPTRFQTLLLTYANIGANFTGFPLAFAFIILFGISGALTLLMIQLGLVAQFNIYSISGLVLVYCYFQVPLAVLLIFPSLQVLTPEIEEAAVLVGASRIAFWRRIGFPMLTPSLLSTSVLLFANAMGTYATAFALVGGNANLTTIRIGELVAGDVFSDPNLADALAMILVIALAVPILFEQIVLRRIIQASGQSR